MFLKMQSGIFEDLEISTVCMWNFCLFADENKAVVLIFCC